MNDEMLIKRCLAGDTEAFSVLVRKHQSAVYRLCLHKTKNPSDAQDLVQEIFVKAYLDLGQLRDIGKFAYWLYGVASNVCYSWWRQVRRKRRIRVEPLEETLDMGNHPVDASPMPAEQLEYRELSASIAQVISTLSEKNQLVVTLYYLDGLSYREIAGFLDLPISAIKSRLNKARRQLKEEVIKMVRSDAKSNPLPADVVEKIVQQALAKAQTYGMEYDKALYRETSDQCDIALDALAQLADTPQYLQWKAQAFRMKGAANFAHYPVASQGALSYYEQALAHFERVLEIKRKSGDKRDYANYLNFISSRYIYLNHFIDGKYPIEERHKACVAGLHEALAIFDSLNDAEGQAVSHRKLGEQAFYTGDFDDALNHFQRARGGLPRNWKTVCDVATEVIPELKKVPSKEAILRGEVECLRLLRESNRVIYVGQPGFSARRDHKMKHLTDVRLVHFISQIDPILDLSWKVGQKWEQDGFSYTFTPLKVKKTFESDSETVQTPAGEFTNCWKFRIEATQSPLAEADEELTPKYELNKMNCGTREFWFAPGVGLVKYRANQESGANATVELTRYHLRDDNPNDYFPLVVGNWWEYRPVGLPKYLIFKDRHEVVYQEGDRFFISHPKYAYWNGDKEELEAILESSKFIVGDYH